MFDNQELPKFVIISFAFMTLHLIFKGDTVSRNWKLATLICYKINKELSVQTTCYRTEKTTTYLYSIT